jgi:hypothetical protein
MKKSVGAGPEGLLQPRSFLWTERTKLKRIVRYIIPALLVLVTCYGGICWATDITVNGSWSKTINASNLQAGAGSDLTGTYESTSATITISVYNTVAAWRVDVQKLDGNWHSSFHLYVKRTTDGVGDGSISGGLTYQEITALNQGFYTGTKTKAGVSIRFQLTGVSIQVPPGVYTTTVIFTVSDT